MSANLLSKKKLWKVISKQKKLQSSILELRNIAEVISSKTASVMPQYTDHSIKHMDDLWDVCERVFTEHEIKLFTESEAFVLGCSFYTHDLAMAILATSEGERRAKETTLFTSQYKKLLALGYPEEHANGIALKLSVRDLHGEFAQLFMEEHIPGLARHLIEQSDIRSMWGRFIGDISNSHMWSLQKVDKLLGCRRNVPDPLGATIDLGFVACALRIIDYAHINYRRASPLERMLRGEISHDSMMHWMAQEQITGPVREDNMLVYGAMRPIADINAWWTFYELASGLDREIGTVREYLAARSCSAGRFSLDGVKGIKTPNTFSSFVIPEGFEPVDLQFRPDSMERLVTLLGGKQLYGNDPHAALRELLQNSCDAINIRKKVEENLQGGSVDGAIHVEIKDDDGCSTLVVSDNGVGMNEEVITKYLLGIASDYWHSNELINDFPDIYAKGFSPVGRFGIGFLSVFMIGDDVDIRTQRRNGHSLKLQLKGVGRRGSLYSTSPTLDSGTTVNVRLTKQNRRVYDNLPAIIKAKAPMVAFPIRVTIDSVTTEIMPKWWLSLSQNDFLDFVYGAAFGHPNPNMPSYQLTNLKKWPGKQPEIVKDTYRILAVPSASRIIICSKGFVVTNVSISGLTGIIDVGETDLDASRKTILNADAKGMRETLVSEIRKEVISALDRISNEVNIPAKYRFISTVVSSYGHDVLLESSLPWITTVVPPGESKLITTAQMIEDLAGKTECAVAFGEEMHPWSVLSLIQDIYPKIPKECQLLPVPCIAQSKPGSYDDKEVEIQGTLSEHFFSYNAALDTAYLLVATITAIATAWDISVESIVNTEWIRKKRVVFGLLKRSQLC